MMLVTPVSLFTVLWALVTRWNLDPVSRLN